MFLNQIHAKAGRRQFLSQAITCCLFNFIPLKYVKMMKPRGITIHQSNYTVKQTVDLIQSFLKDHGATVYARINQQTEVNNTGQHLLPLEFILFGNPISGGPFMIKDPLIALDLPLKIISWQDEQEKVWLAYNEAAYIEERYSLFHQPGSPLNLDNLINTIFNK